MSQPRKPSVVGIDVVGIDVVGIDVGGANLKYATSVAASQGESPGSASRSAHSRFFPMWRNHDGLAEAIAEDLQVLGAGSETSVLASTMTGELADCFAAKPEGVRHIVSHVCRAADQLGVESAVFYGIDGCFHSASEAVQRVDLIAAANWHALASFVGSTICRDGLLVDVGSTTTDIVPIADGRVATEAQTDYDRLCERSLVYVGGRRTPVCAMVQDVSFRGRRVPVMNELFATMDDARLLLGFESEDAADRDSADGKPRTAEMAASRMARMIGLDCRSFSLEDGVALARQVHRSGALRIAAAIDELRKSRGGLHSLVISGQADDLIERPDGVSVVQLRDRLGEAMSRCAPSYAVAWLWQQSQDAR